MARGNLGEASGLATRRRSCRVFGHLQSHTRGRRGGSTARTLRRMRMYMRCSRATSQGCQSWRARMHHRQRLQLAEVLTRRSFLDAETDGLTVALTADSITDWDSKRIPTYKL